MHKFKSQIMQQKATKYQPVSSVSTVHKRLVILYFIKGLLEADWLCFHISEN